MPRQAGNEWTRHVAQRIGEHVAYFRWKRDLPLTAVARKCADLGMPQMSRTSLSKLENGYRESVTVPELLVLASVLDVAPMALLFGHGIDDKTEMLPGQHCEPWDAVQWFTGPRWLAAHADAGPGGNAMSANPDGAGRRIARLLAEGMRRREPDLCARCGNQFPPEQVCARCQTDSGTLTAAAVIVRNRSRRNGFWTRVLARVLELAAARLEAK